jgi:hypothetical protein
MNIDRVTTRHAHRLRPIWIWVAAALGLLAGGTEFCSQHPHPFETVAEHAARLAEMHGIVIGYGHPSTFYVSPYGPADAAIENLHMLGADPRDLPPALDGIEASLAMYPPGFVSSLVQAIFIAGELRDHGEVAGGSTGPAWFVLAASESDSSNSEGIRLTSLKGVHHELSSFVLHKAGITEEWTAFAPADWGFSNTSEEALAHGGDHDPAPETGFLSAYGATTAENDFNTYAERIFTESGSLLQLACKHALVRQKLLFVLRTYVTLDARLEKTFRELGFDGAHLCDDL